MNKKIIVLIVIILIIGLGIGTYFFINKDSKKDLSSSNEQIENPNESNEEKVDPNSKSVVLYFSATGNTKKVAEYISDITNSKLIEIVPEEKYTDNDLNYNNDDSRVNKEHNDSKSRPKIKNNIDIESYDTIYLGYPIWWGDVPNIIRTFIENNDFEGKTIIPFCTSSSTGMSESLKTLKSYKDLNITGGRRFSSSASKSDVSSWLEEID